MNKLLALLVLSLLCAAPVAAQSFGAAAGVAGGDVLFGQTTYDREPGSIYVYRQTDGTWREAAKLHASDGIPGDMFGSTIAVDGDRMVVGASLADSGRGAAYVFERGPQGTWREAARLLPADSSRRDSLGTGVALRGDVALVAYGSTPDSGSTRQILAFRRDPSGTWRPIAPIQVPGVNPVERFARGVIALGEGFAAVSAAGRDSATGVVWVFPARAEGWGEPVVLTGPEKRSAFGSALAFVGDRLLVGAPGLGMNRGAVIVYEQEGDAWREVGRVEPEAPSQPPAPVQPGQGPPPHWLFFGVTIVPAGDGMWVGAPAANRFRGAIYEASPERDGWDVSLVDFGIEDLEGGDGLGSAIAVGGDIAAIGLSSDDYGFGTGSIVVRSDDDWRLASKVFSEIEPLAAVRGKPVPCTGSASGFSCSNVDLIAFLPVQSLGGARGAELNDIWGWTDPETRKEYALVGRQDGTSFVDVTDPENPVLVGQLPKTEGAPGSTWRDIKVYKDHAFIVADGAEDHGMQVFDLTRLRSASNAPVTFTPETTYHNMHSAHNIVINEDTGFAYTVGNSAGGEMCGGGLHMVDIRDPKNPQFAGCFSDPTTGRSKTGYTHDAQCVLYHGPDEDYRGREICFGSNETALSIADVTEKSSPHAIAMAEYPNVGYTHQAWLTEDHRYLFMDDELDEMNGLVDHTRTLIWDVSDLDDPILAKEFFNPNTISSDHNQYVVGDKVYQSNYVTGLRVLDISDIQETHEVGFFDTVPYGTDGPRFDGSWSNYPFFKSGVIVVTSGDEGLFLLKYRPAGDRPLS
jgi:choice-of-anchor B domain-containing protein